MGTRYAEKIKRKGAEDHPHACGDKLILYWTGSISVGSSPRVWGQALKSRGIDIEHGIIPTRVGTSKA